MKRGDVVKATNHNHSLPSPYSYYLVLREPRLPSPNYYDQPMVSVVDPKGNCISIPAARVTEVLSLADPAFDFSILSEIQKHSIALIMNGDI